MIPFHNKFLDGALRFDLGAAVKFVWTKLLVIL